MTKLLFKQENHNFPSETHLACDNYTDSNGHHPEVNYLYYYTIRTCNKKIFTSTHTTAIYQRFIYLFKYILYFLSVDGYI